MAATFAFKIPDKKDLTIQDTGFMPGTLMYSFGCSIRKDSLLVPAFLIQSEGLMLQKPFEVVTLYFQGNITVYS